MAAGILLLLQASFMSWRLALGTFLTLLIGLAGGLLMAYLCSGIVSLSSLFGLIAVFGINARISTLLIKQYQSLELEGNAFGSELILLGTRERLVPILMTILTTSLILLPFIIFGNIAGQEILYPMAIVILGGLATTIVVTLFLIPVLYLHFEARRKSDLEHTEFEIKPATPGDDLA
jgi:Cu/Ag efflux pump CusA